MHIQAIVVQRPIKCPIKNGQKTKNDMKLITSDLVSIEKSTKEI